MHTVYTRCNLCRPWESYVHVGFGTGDQRSATVTRDRRVVVGGRETGRTRYLVCGRFAMQSVRVVELLLVGGFGAFVEAVHDAAELHRRYVRGCRTRSAGEGERVLRSWIGNIDYHDLAWLEL